MDIRYARSLRFAVLASALVGASLAGPAPRVVAQGVAECRDWVDSGSADTRFKVWACKGEDPAMADAAVAQVAALMDEIWGPMTQPVPTGMGEPLADAAGTNMDLEHGRDARIDVYALLPGQGVFRGGKVQSIRSSSAAAAGVSLLAEPARGARPNGASGYMLIDRSRLPDDIAMRQDLIHEFFHVLEYAHNAYAPFRDPQHWFVEASATWAETYYLRDHSDTPHRWFDRFQTFTTGLEDPDPVHAYAAYVWPFFMEQEVGRDGIMETWAAMDGLAQGADHDAVTDVIDRQLPFAAHFRDFAVRNLNNDALEESDPPETLYDDLDEGFHDGVPPRIRPGSVSPDSALHLDESVPPLAGRYHDLTITEDARLVTISIADLAPASAVDGDAIVHVADGWWERRPLANGKLEFCRDDEEAYDDIDHVYLVISNHDRHETASGFVKASAEDTCEQDRLVLEGTIRGTAWETSPYGKTRGTIEGSMTVTITIEPHDWVTEGHARISGEYTGDCQYQDSGSGPFRGTMRDPGTAEDGRMSGSVDIYPWDQEFVALPLDRLAILPSIVIRRWGGTCGHDVGVVEDAFPQLNVSMGGCAIELTRNGGSWRGACRREDDYSGHEWSADFVQIEPSPAP